LKKWRGTSIGNGKIKEYQPCDGIKIKTIMEEQLNQRKNTRFKARDGSVAVVKYKCSSKFGIINDISRGGLAFRYLVTDFDLEENSQELFELNIVCKPGGLPLLIGPCKIIKDNYIPPEYSICLGLMRKSSVQFGEMTPDQKLRLEYFIENFTEDSVSEPSYITAS
jgi:hypothetical protein